MNFIPSTLVCAYNCTFIIDYERNIYSFGGSLHSENGHGDGVLILSPKKIGGLTNIKQVACGEYHTLCLDFNSNVYSFGLNDKGQLGIGSVEVNSTHKPQKINIPPIQQVCCGESFSLCLSNDKCLYSFGNNKRGQLGLGNDKQSISPQLITTIKDIQLVECGDEFVICTTLSGNYSWGYNADGQIASGDYESCDIPLLRNNWPNNISFITCGVSYTLFLTFEGHVYSCGYNVCGELGINEPNTSKICTPRLVQGLPEIKRIKCGYDHNLCIDIDDNLWIFGYNSFGQLGLGDTENRFAPEKHTFFPKVIDVSHGGCHTFIKTIDNTVYSFGDNGYFQTGISTSKENQLTPTQVLKGNEDIWCTIFGKSKAKSARK